MTSHLPGPQDRVLLPLRAFLGVTFCFAGLQKLASHGFFDASNPASIQAQLAAAARRSPIHPLLSPLTHVAVAIGLLIALGELAVGVGTLLGLWSRLAAVGGIVLAVMLFLTVSFHTSPYYTGADIVFAFAWTPLALANPGPWSLDTLIADRTQTAAEQRADAGKGTAAAAAASRRDAMFKVMVTAAVAVGTLVAGGMTAAIGRLVGGGTPNTASGGPSPLSSSTTQPGSASAPAAGGSAGGRAIGPASGLPVGQAALFTDPATSDPAIILHPSPGTFLAFDAVCPHAGCTVQYQPSAGLLVCPCHGSQFNATTGAVEVGPAATGLTPIRITRGPGDQLYAS